MSRVIYPKGGRFWGAGNRAGWKAKLSWTCLFDLRCMKDIQMAVSNREGVGFVSLDRAREPSGLEIEMWELLACRSLGAWEKGDAQGTAKVKCFATVPKFCCWAQASKWGWQHQSNCSGLALARGPSVCMGL